MEIYIRRPYTTTYDANTIEINDTLEIFLQEIEMILSTPMTSVLGAPQFGASLDLYLHNVGLNEGDIKSRIANQIQTYSQYATDFNWDVNVTFYIVNETETAVVEVTVEKDNIIRLVV